MTRKTQDRFWGPSVSPLLQVMVSSVLSIGQNMYQSIADIATPLLGWGACVLAKGSHLLNHVKL